jgi:diguanylate cyclase (GGDEF)-like protein/PAS domain S-box-containing protein
MRSPAALIETVGVAHAGDVLALAGIALVVVDARLCIVDLNEAAATMLGGRDAARGTRLCPDGECDDLRRLVETALEGQASSVFECACPLRDDPGAWCEVSCMPLGSTAALILRDVTAARRSEQRYRSIIETAVDGIIVIDEHGVIDSVNPAIERIFGYTRDELVGENVSVLMPEPDRSRHDSYIARYLASGDPKIIGIGREVTARRKGGSTFPLRLSVGVMTSGGRRMFTGIVSDLTERKAMEEELRRIEVRNRSLTEQAALRRVATAVASESDPQKVFDLVAHEAALLFGASAGLVCRFDNGVGAVVGRWYSGVAITALTLPLDGRSALAEVRRTGASARIDDAWDLGEDPVASLVGRSFRSRVAAPIPAPGGPWGAILLADFQPGGFAPGVEKRLADFAELVAMAVNNAATRARLSALAASDPLTGLANHRTFHERLHGEAARAVRHSHPLALVMVDIDHFKAINDSHGHDVGDRVLLEMSRRLRAEAREGEIVARVGGEEFAWILPETDLAGAHRAAQRLLATISSRPFPVVGRVTASAGVCDLHSAGNSEDLFRFADGALYWAKRQGRNLVCDYAPSALDSLSAAEHAARLEQAQALASIRVLARVVDAKDPSTTEHSVRVAAMAVRLATALDWESDRIARLHEAGLLHDVGKIGIPDAVLFKAGRLTDDEFAVI